MVPYVRTLMFIAALCGGTVLAIDSPTTREIWERFDEKRLQRDMWNFDPRSPAGTVHSIDANNWKLTIPGGTGDRSPASLVSRCQLKGNFRVEMDYQLLKVPTLKNGNLQVAIFVSGPDGHAAVMRAIYHQLGHGYSVWYEPTDKSRPGHWENHPTSSMSGRLRIRRLEKELVLEAHCSGESKAINIGRVPFGNGPIDHLEIRVVVPETKGIAQVVIDDIHITADQIVHPQPPAISMVGRRAWLAVVAVCVLLAVGGGLTLVYQK